MKVSPLARWTDDDVDRYIAENDVLVNPLQYDGYPSIGCWPCTRRVAPGEDPRSGRWAGTGKTECGIHHDHRTQQHLDTTTASSGPSPTKGRPLP